MNTVVAQRPAQKPIELIRAQLYLPSMQEQLKSALPPHVTVEKFLRVAMTALQQNPDLLKYDRNSLFAAVVTSAQLGLLPDAQLGEAYFVPFKGKVTLVPGYRGLLKLARQGDIGFVEAELIHVNDRTTYVLGDDSRLECIVNWEDRGPIKAGYAVAKYRDGGIAARVVMTKAEIDDIRARSQNANGPAWSENYAEMAKKTVLRRLAKLLPLSTTANNAFRLSELHEEMAKGGRVIEGQVIEDEEAPKQPMPEMAPEPKPRRRRTALDDIPSTAPTNPPQGRTASPDAADDDLKVDPETGQIDFGDNDDGPPSPVQG
jgi:recombination protein RecT